MEPNPVLTLYVTEGCPVCRRTERVLRSCEQIASLVRLNVVWISTTENKTPAKVISAPTLMFGDEIVGLGTPDCGELAERLRATLQIVP